MDQTYLNRGSTVEGGGDVVPFTTVGPEHRYEFFILVIVPRSSLDVWVEGFSPSLRKTVRHSHYQMGRRLL